MIWLRLDVWVLCAFTPTFLSFGCMTFFPLLKAVAVAEAKEETWPFLPFPIFYPENLWNY